MHPQSLNMQFAFKAMLISHDRILPYGTFLSLRLVHPSHPPASGGCAYCEVVISGKKDGPFSTQLQCSIEHAAAPLLLPLQGCIQVRYVHLFTCGSQNTSTCALLVAVVLWCYYFCGEYFLLRCILVCHFHSSPPRILLPSHLLYLFLPAFSSPLFLSSRPSSLCSSSSYTTLFSPISSFPSPVSISPPSSLMPEKSHKAAILFACLGL